MFLVIYHFFFLLMFWGLKESLVLMFKLFFGFLNESLTMVLVFDFFSSGFSSIIFLIVFVAIFYSTFYMMGDLNLKRFLIMVLMFVLSMYFLVLSPSLVMMMVGWDGLGMVSFLLVIYYNNVSSLRSGLITVYMNRLGDLFFIFSFFLSYWWGFLDKLGMVVGEVFLFMLFILICSITKSAQIPFSSWLPAAMAAPTPVSSLVHSSTLVTAGIYLSIRFFFFFSFKFLCQYFLYVSLVTSLMAGFMACVEIDLKKLVAMSTLSHLGLMMFILMLGSVENCFFHLLVHALFKSLLFLSCGFMILVNLSNQDMRFLNIKFFLSKNFYMLLIISCLSMCGLPFFSGFFSKDFLLEVLFLWGSNIFVLMTYLICCLFSVFYSVKLIRLGLMSEKSAVSVEEGFFNLKLIFFLYLLGFWAIFLGYFFTNFVLDFENYLVFFFEKIFGFFFFIFIIFLINVWLFFIFEMFYLNFFSGKMFSSFGLIFSIVQMGESFWSELVGGKSFFYFLMVVSLTYFYMKKFFKSSVVLLSFLMFFVL